MLNHRNFLYTIFKSTLVFSFLTLTVACGSSSSDGGNGAPPVAGTIPCNADVPPGTPLFTASPFALADVTEVIPLGNVAPASHVLAVDHMYVHHALGAGDGSVTYPVNAMAAGDVYMIEQVTVMGRADDDYHIYIKHTCSTSSYYFHLMLKTSFF